MTHVAVDHSTHEGPAHPCPQCDEMDISALQETTVASDSPEYRIAELEYKLDTVIWLHAELTHRQIAIANTMAALLAQQVQPQMQQAILNQILSG